MMRDINVGKFHGILSTVIKTRVNEIIKNYKQRRLWLAVDFWAQQPICPFNRLRDVTRGLPACACIINSKSNQLPAKNSVLYGTPCLCFPFPFQTSFCGWIRLLWVGLRHGKGFVGYLRVFPPTPPQHYNTFSSLRNDNIKKGRLPFNFLLSRQVRDGRQVSHNL